MSFGRRTIVGLLAWFTLGRAHAAQVQLLDPGTLSPLPGETVTLQFHIPGLMPGDRVKAKGINGQARARPVTRTGLLVVDYRVPRSGSVPDEHLLIRSRSLGIDETVELHFDAHDAALGLLRFDPQWVETRPGGAAYVEIRTSKLSPDAPWLSSSIGDLSEARNEGEDWVWTWSTGQAPEASAIAGFLMMEPSQPEQPAAWGSLPIHITQSLTIQARPGYICELVQGEEHSEGVAVTPAGTLAMTVAVDPTKTAAIVDCVNPVGQQRRYPVELQLGDVPRLALGSLSPKIPADPQSSVPLHLLILDPDGQPAVTGTPTIQCTSGEVEEPEKTALAGLWRSSWSPGPKSEDVQCVATHNGHDQELELRTVPSTLSMAIEANPPVLGPDQTTIEVLITGVASGAQLPGGLPSISTRGASRVTRLRASKGGASQKLRLLKGRPGIWLLGSPPPSPLGLPATQVLTWAPSPVMLADGQSERPVAIGVSDALGQGVPNVQVKLSVEPPERGSIREGYVTTAANGLAWVWVRSGSEDGPLLLRAVIEGDESTAPLHTLPDDGEVCTSEPERCEPLSFIIDGDRRSRQLEQAWRERAVLSWVPYREKPPEAELAQGTEESSDPLIEAPQELISIDPGLDNPIAQQPNESQEDGPRLRFSAGAASLSHVYFAEANLAAAAPSPHAEQRGNLLEGKPIGSLAGSAHLLVELGKMQVDAGWLGGKIHLGDDEDLDPAAFHQGWAGLRKSTNLSAGLIGHLGIAADYQSFHVLVYDVSKPGELIMAEIPAPGARLSGGVSWTNEKVWTELELSNALVPWPVRTTGSFRIQFQTLPDLVTSIGLDMSFRSARFAAGADEVWVQDQLHVLSLGLGTTLP